MKDSGRVDKRIIRSRAAIMQAFEKLLLEKPISDITVSAIAREAGIDRKTFYVHFGTVDGLLDAIAEDAVNSIVDMVNEKTGDHIEDITTAQEAIATFFSILNEAICHNMLLNRRIIENIPLEDFMTRIRKPLEYRLRERQYLPESLVDDMYDYYLSFMLCGIIGIYRSWAMSDGSIPLERVSAVANELSLYGLSSLKERFNSES